MQTLDIQVAQRQGNQSKQIHGNGRVKGGNDEWAGAHMGGGGGGDRGTQKGARRMGGNEVCPVFAASTGLTPCPSSPLPVLVNTTGHTPCPYLSLSPPQTKDTSPSPPPCLLPPALPPPTTGDTHCPSPIPLSSPPAHGKPPCTFVSSQQDTCHPGTSPLPFPPAPAPAPHQPQVTPAAPASCPTTVRWQTVRSASWWSSTSRACPTSECEKV